MVQQKVDGKINDTISKKYNNKISIGKNGFEFSKQDSIKKNGGELRTTSQFVFANGLKQSSYQWRYNKTVTIVS